MSATSTPPRSVRRATAVRVLTAGFAAAAALAVALQSPAGRSGELSAAAKKPADKKGAAAGFAPVAPAKLLLDRAKLGAKRVAGDIDDSAEIAAKEAALVAEWVNVQVHRDDKALSAWAAKTAGLYAGVAKALIDGEKPVAAAKLKDATKQWAEYDKNAKAWGAAKPLAGTHKRLTADLDPLMGLHKEIAAQGSGSVAKAVLKGDVSANTDELLLLAEMGNLLISDRADPKWKTFATNLREGSLHLIEVGKKGDPTALKPALNEVQKACNDCHGDFRK